VVRAPVTDRRLDIFKKRATVGNGSRHAAPSGVARIYRKERTMDKNIEKVLYTAKVHIAGGRDGTAVSSNAVENQVRQ
jgi:hypothetical protein